MAGVDRLNLGEELAIQDLLAAARFVLLPQDDLNLACLLKSPLVGLGEEQLFTLAWKRTGHLWRALRERAGEAPFAAAHARLSAWLRRADYITPFDFFAQALGPEGGRVRPAGAAGPRGGRPDRRAAGARAAVPARRGRLAAGLPALVRGGRRRDQARSRPEPSPRGAHPDGARVEGPAGADRLPARHDPRAARCRAAAGRRRRRGPAVAAARRRRQRGRAQPGAPRPASARLQEQNRLLYVAMTRAEDRLYVGGWVGAKKPDRGCWYERIEAGLRASSDAGVVRRIGEPRGRAVARVFDFTAQLGDEGWSGDGYELTNPGSIEIPEQAELPLEMAARLEPWVHQPAPAEPDPPTPLAPSQPLPDEALASPRAFSPLAPDDSRRWQRGRLLHELLRHLPALPAAARAPAARRFLAQPAHGLTDEEISLWVDEVARRHRGARSRRLVRRRLARRGAADRHGEDAARHLHRERPGRPAGRLRARGADRRLQDQPAAARSRPRAWRWPIAGSSRSIARCSPTSIPAAPYGLFSCGQRLLC